MEEARQHSTVKALGDLPLTHAKAEATVEAVDGTLDFVKLWLSAVGAIVVLTMSASYLAREQIYSLSTFSKSALVVAFLFELFELYVVSRVADNLLVCQTAYRIYLKTPQFDPSMPEVMRHVDLSRGRVTSSANVGMFTAFIIFVFLLYAYYLVVFQ